jgi:hypothetical protein
MGSNILARFGRYRLARDRTRTRGFLRLPQLDLRSQARSRYAAAAAAQRDITAELLIGAKTL